MKTYPESVVMELREALGPFSRAFEDGGKWHYTDHPEREKWFEFQDRNQVIPSRNLTMGDFRRAADALAKLDAYQPVGVTVDDEYGPELGGDS